MHAKTRAPNRYRGRTACFVHPCCDPFCPRKQQSGQSASGSGSNTPWSANQHGLGNSRHRHANNTDGALCDPYRAADHVAATANAYRVPPPPPHSSSPYNSQVHVQHSRSSFEEICQPSIETAALAESFPGQLQQATHRSKTSGHFRSEGRIRRGLRFDRRQVSPNTASE